MTRTQRERLHHPDRFCPVCRNRLAELSNRAMVCQNYRCPAYGRMTAPLRGKKEEEENQK
jgi:hypothetical protein